MITRFLQKRLISSIKPNKVIGLFGARRTGKTILMKEIRKKLNEKNILMVDGENLDVAEILSSQRLALITSFVKGYKYLFIDEAQKIFNIGINLKLIVDNIRGLHIFVTGSSAFDLRNKLGEPLTGRSQFFYLYPIAQLELNEDFLKAKENLENRLIYVSDPQVIISKTEKKKRIF